MAFVKPPARNMPPGSEPWAQWVEEQVSSVTKKSVEAYQYAERAAGGVNSALEGNVQNWDEINRVFEVTEKSMQLADGAVVWSTLDPELPEDVPINPNVIWYTYDPETREVLRMWQWGYYDDVEGVYVEDWYQAQLGADSIHDEAITSAKVALGAIDWDQIAPDVENTVTTAQETAEKAATDAAQAKTDVITAINKANSAVVTADEAKTAANTAQTDATSAQTAAQQAKTAADTAKTTADTAASDLLILSGKTGRVIRSTTAPTGTDRNSNNLWLNTTTGQLSEWAGTAWKVITDSRLTAATSAAATAQTRADQAANTAGAAQERADLAKDLADAATLLAGAADSKAATAQAAATAAGSSAASAQSKADTAFANAATAQSTADQAKTAANSAQSKADTAASDLLALAGKSGRLIRSATAPTSADDKNANNLWLNTGNGQLSQWTGTAWTLITDSRLTAATSAAAAAQSTADTAKTNAATAQAKADSAFTNAATAKTAADNAMAAALGAQAKADTADAKASTADGRITIATANPTAANAVGKPIGALWEVRSGSTVLRRFVLTAASTWTQVKAGQDFIGENAIGAAQIMDAAVGTLQVANGAITDAKIGTLAVDKLRVVGGATMPVAVIDSLVSDQAFVDKVVSEGVLVAPGNLMADKTLGNLWTTSGTGTEKVVPNTTSGRFGGPALTAAFTSATQYPFYYGSSATAMRPHLIPVTVGREPLVVSFWARSVGGAGGPVSVWRQEWTDAYARTATQLSPSHEVTTTWQQFTTVITPTASATWLGMVLTLGPGAGTLHVSDVRIERQTGPVLIEDGAVTAPKITASEELSAKVAEFLSVKTGQITWDNAAGNTAFIGALVGNDSFIRNMYSSRVVVSADNLMPDPYFDLGTAVWNVDYATTAPGNTGISSDVTYQGHPYAVRLTQNAAGTSNMSLYAPNLRDLLSVAPTCTPGEKIVASCMFYLDKALPTGAIAGSGFDCRVYFYREDGTMFGNTSAGAVTTPPVGSWFQAGGNPLTVPADAVRFRVVPTVYLAVGYTPNDAKIYIGQVEAKRQVGSVLIEDGAVTAPKIFAQAITAEKIAVGALDAFQITSPLIQSVSTANRGIKWNGNSFVAYNNSGVEMIRLEGDTGAITGVTITGGTVRTAASGQRIQLVSSGDMYAYAPNGVETLRIQTADDDGGATYFRGPAVGTQRSYLRLGRGVVGGTDTAQAWLGFAGGNRPSRVWVHSYGAFYVGGERGSVQIENTTGELRLYSSAGLIGLYGIPTTTSTGNPITAISGGSLISLYRNTSLAKYKLDPRDLSADDPYRVLQLRPRDWWDKTAMDQVADGVEAEYLRAEGEEVPERLALREAMPLPHRVPGFVAEEVEAVIPELATWDGDGNLSGVAYDRVPAYLLVAMKAMKTEIDELRAQLETEHP